MGLTVYAYPKCSTCRKAQKWLDEHQLDYKVIHIVDEPPTKSEIQNLIAQSDQPIKKFFNTSGMKYRELGLKDKVKTASEDEMLEWLASDGMLLKRPIVTDGKKVTVGFQEDKFTSAWL